MREEIVTSDFRLKGITWPAICGHNNRVGARVKFPPRHGGSPTHDRRPSGRGQSVQGAAEAGGTGRGRGWTGVGFSGLGASVRSARAEARRRLIALRSLFFQVL